MTVVVQCKFAVTHRPVARGGSGGSIEPPFWINPGIQLVQYHRIEPVCKQKSGISESHEVP